MLDLAARCSATFTGLTVSAQQAAVAARAIDEGGLEPPHHGQHRQLRLSTRRPVRRSRSRSSRWPTRRSRPRALAALTRAARAGRAARDRRRHAGANARGTRDLALFQSGWRLPVLSTAAELTTALERRGLAIVDAAGSDGRAATADTRAHRAARDAEPHAAPRRAVRRPARAARFVSRRARARAPLSPQPDDATASSSRAKQANSSAHAAITPCRIASRVSSATVDTSSLLLSCVP